MTHWQAALDVNTKNELLDTVRHEFDRHRNEKDLEKIKYYLSRGQRDFRQFQSSLDLSLGK
jgi:hypothetical protein